MSKEGPVDAEHAEIGGYFELGRSAGVPLHAELVALNCGRGCISYLVELRGIRKVWLPDWMCDSVSGRFAVEGVLVKTYRVGENFRPVYDFKVERGEWLYLMDYYGQLTAEDVSHARTISAGCLIVDEAQAYYRAPWDGCDTTYTCRKWFGVADGAFLATRDGDVLDRPLDVDESHLRMGFVLGRFERTASEFFSEASRNNEFFDSEPAKGMSRITYNLLSSIDYDATRLVRARNWNTLSSVLGAHNRLDLVEPTGPFMYPLYCENASEVRTRLIAGGIYVPILWPNVLREASEGSWGARYSEHILPLPIDQRYGADEMERIIEGLEGAGVSVG